MTSDPKMKRSKDIYVCAHCGAELNEVTIKNQDPFCSTACAHDFHGVEILMPRRGFTVGSSS